MTAADKCPRCDILHARVVQLEVALEKITKREGRFSWDHHEHANNTIDSMASIAEAALFPSGRPLPAGGDAA